ncbi:hypothetical protein [Thiolapillus sp.]
MRRIISAILLLLSIGTAPAYDRFNNNPFVDMMRAMLDMFESMQAMQSLSAHSGYRPYPPNTSPSPGYGLADTPTLAQLEGSWASPNRILLIIRQNYARMYWSADQYRDFYLEILPGRLKMTDADTYQSQEFELRLWNRQLAMRDPKGRVLQFLRLAETPASRTIPEVEENYNFWDPNTP